MAQLAALALATAAPTHADATALALSRVQEPVQAEEILTVDQIRIPTSTDQSTLRLLADDHSMDEVAKTLAGQGVKFDRQTVEMRTSTLSLDVLAQIKLLPPSEPWVIPTGQDYLINMIITRRPAVAGRNHD